MRKALLLIVIVVIATPLFAAQGYVGLYADAEHSDCDVYLSGGFMPFEAWIWFLPPSVGLQAVEYKITVPAGVITSTVTTNPDILIIPLGDWWDGTSLSFSHCQNGWTWTQRIACYLTSSEPLFILIGPHPYSGLQFASCETAWPVYPLTVLNQLALNQACVVATESMSWGAIKSLF